MLCPAWPQGRQNPPSSDGFCQVWSPRQTDVFSRRVFCPCTWSWGSWCRICGRSWLPSGSTPLPSCHMHRSVFGMNSHFLEENREGMEAGEGCEGQGVFSDCPHSPSVEFGVSQVISCLGCGAAWPWREHLLHFLSAVSLGICLDHWDVLCFGPWNNEFALGESEQLWQFPIQDGRIISSSWVLASPRGNLQALNFPITQQTSICLTPDAFPVFPPTSLCVVSRPGCSKGGLGEDQAPQECGWLCLPAQSSALAPLSPQVIWFPRKEYL